MLRLNFVVLAMAFCLNAWADEFVVGVCTHFAFGTNEPVKTMELLQAAGVTSFRDEVPWEHVETKKGVFKFPDRLGWVDRAVDMGRGKGIQPLIILNYGNKLYAEDYPISDEAQAAFVRYAEFIVKHFKGRVKYYEVWNEWNLKGKPEDYARLLKKVYPALKKIDPSIVILGGSVGGVDRPTFIETMLREDALSAMDGLSIHPYVYWKGVWGTPESLVRYVEELQKDVLQKASGGKPVPIYITEAGWPTNVGLLGFEQNQVGDYLARTLLLLRTLPYVRGVWWYDLRNDGDNRGDREHNFGLVSTKYIPKPAYSSLQHASELVAKGAFVARLPSDPDMWVLKFRKPDNSEALAAWHTNTSGRWRFDLDKSALPSQVLSARRVGKDPEKRNLESAADSSTGSVEVSGTPVMIENSGPINVKRINRVP